MRIIHGDCLAEMDKLITEGVKVDAIITDPPYGTTACKWDSIIPFDAMWERLNKLIKPNGAIVLFGSEPFSSALRMSNIKNYKYDWYWEKDKAANWMFGNKMPLKTFETVSVFYESQPTYNPQKTVNPSGVSKRHLYKNPSKITDNVKAVMGDGWKETEMDATGNYHGKTYEPDKLLPRQSIYFAREQKGKQHPTQKPVALMEYLIKTYTNEGETVLDFTMGSGTTGVACKNTNRDFIGIELDENYYNIANDRIEKTIVNKEEHYLQHTQQLDLFDPESIQESIYQGEML